MLKRLISMFLTALMLLPLVGCGGTAGIEAPNGALLEETEAFGVPAVQYAGTTVPKGLGLPELTDEEIDALLAENDPRKVKESISTLADFINYCYRGKFVFGDGLIFISTDYNLILTTSSGYQTLDRRIGQCASMSSCLHYVLADDYEEVGYVYINGHIMAYIFCDGLYYLINPVEYVYTNGRWPNRWLEYLPDTEVIYCSSDFQDIADSIYGKEIGERITYVYTCVSPGDVVDPGPVETFPLGTTAVCWYGSPVNYCLFTEYDWVSQENVVDDVCIVMYAPEEPPYFTFSGSHEKDNKVGPANTPEDVPAFTSSENAAVAEYLKEIGAIAITNTELGALAETGDLNEISSTITTAEDCVRFIVAAGIKEGDNGSIESAFTEKILWPDKIVELACRILEGDYEDVGMITTTPTSYCFLYVKQNDVYSIYDVLRAIHGTDDGHMTFDSSEAMLEYAIAERGDSEATIEVW